MKNIKALMCMLAMVAVGTLISSCKKDRTRGTYRSGV
jgi:hypothetical protein